MKRKKPNLFILLIYIYTFILYLCCVLKHASAHCLSEAEETDV